MTDYTAAVDTFAEFEFNRNRRQVAEAYNLDEDQIPTYSSLDHASLLHIKEDALDLILEIEPQMENVILSRIADDKDTPQEVVAFILHRMMSNDLDSLF